MAGRRQDYRSGKGCTGVLIVLILLLAAVGGAAYVFRDQVRYYVAKWTRSVDSTLPDAGRNVEPAGDVERRPKPRTGVDRPPRPAPPPASAVTASAQILALIDEAEASLARLEFDKAQSGARQVLASNPPMGARQKADDIFRRASTYGDLLSGVTVNPEAAGKLSILRGENMDIKVVIEREDHEYYYVILDNGIRAPISKEEVIEVVAVDEADKRADVEGELQAVKKENADRGAVGLYLAAVFAYRNLLSEEVLPLLDEAYRQDPDFRSRVHDYHASRLLYKAIWHDSIGLSYHAKVFLTELVEKYPNSTHVATARKTLAEIESRKKETVISMKVEEKTPAPRPPWGPRPAATKPPSTARASRPEPEPEYEVKIPKVVAMNPRVKAMVDEANGYFEKAMKHYMKGRPGKPNFNEELRQAAVLFEKAEALYNRALGMDPKNTNLENRASDAARLRYNSTKMQTLGG